MAGGEEGHHVVDELVFGEGVGGEGGGDYVVGAGGFAGGEGLSFGLDQAAGGVAGDGGGGSDVVVAFDGDGTEEDVGEEEGKET